MFYNDGGAIMTSLVILILLDLSQTHKWLQQIDGGFSNNILDIGLKSPIQIPSPEDVYDKEGDGEKVHPH